jgi:hypothetical protein
MVEAYKANPKIKQIFERLESKTKWI